MPDLYTEDLLVEQPAIEIFKQQGWSFISAKEERLGLQATLGRETKSEVVLVSKLRTALENLNPQLPPEAIKSAVEETERDRSAMSLAAANRGRWITVAALRGSFCFGL
jgi:type I restriction enzyme R subunit